jgi:hypothetical protein
MLGPTLFECPKVPRHFLFWDWMAETHVWAEVKRWTEPLHYGTCFCTLKQCVKCWEERIEYNEQYGP